MPIHEMPRYSVRVLIEELKEKYESGSMFITHDELMVLLMTYVLDGKGDDDTRYWGLIFALIWHAKAQGVVVPGNIPGVEVRK